MGSKRKLNNHTKGMICIICSAFFFSLMAVFVRLSGDLPTMEKAFFRNIVALLVAAGALLKFKGSGESIKMPKGSGKYLFARAAFGTMGLIFNFYAIDRIGIADANMLNKMAPFFAIIMSIFIMREIPHKIEWICVIGALAGAALIVKPTSGIFSAPALIGLLGGFGAGTAYTFVRKLGTHGVKRELIVFVFSLFSSLVTLPGMLMDFKPMTFTQFIILVLAGAAAAGGQFTVTAAYSYAPAKEISVFDFSQVIFATVWGFLLFDELPDYLSVAGYVIIIVTAFAEWHHNMSRMERKMREEGAD